MLDVIVIGAGQAGLAAGYYLSGRGLRFVILEAGDQAAGSWPHYYNSLRLFSPAQYSSLPGIPFPVKKDQYPTRDEVVNYLTAYAANYQFPIMYHSRVERVIKEKSYFRVTTASGEVYEARSLISATGSFNKPNVPSIPNEATFTGKRLHSSTYISPEPYKGENIVVVGRGNSAVQIAIELSQVADTTLAVREPVSLIPQRLLGRDVHFWLKATGVDTFPFWRFGKNAGNSTAVIDLGGYRAQLAANNPPQKPMFSSFYPEGVVWTDGSRSPVDTVLFATGFLSNLEFLRELGALAEDGSPLHRGGISTHVPGVYYIGLSGQRSLASATLRGVGADAKFVIRHLQGYLKKEQAV